MHYILVYKDSLCRSWNACCRPFAADHTIEDLIIDNCPALVLDADQRSALAVTRSLGRQGVAVHTADTVVEALAAASSFSRGYLQLPQPGDGDDAGFIAAIRDYCQRHRIGIVMPMTEQSAEICLRHREQLDGLILPFASADVIDRLADKCKLTELARSLDIPCPETMTVAAGDATPELNALQYPLVLKPGKSWLQTDSGWLHTAVRFAGDAQQAADILADDPAFALHSYMLQQQVPGKGCGVFALYDHGKAIAFFAHRRIHEKPPRGGVSVISESVELDPVLLEHSRKLLDAVGWHGIAMVEFRSDGKQAWLMEVNTRFWGSLQLAVDAGVDFPWLLYRMATGQQVDAVKDYRKGERMRWLLGDLDWLYLVFKDRDIEFSHKLKALLTFLLWAPLTSRAEVNRLSDLGPFRHELSQYLQHIRSRLGL